ncbi:MAG: carbohydrate-binding domain-containing protein [Eubacterium sp.]|nr:carbohydrate-binding domain-containing protein [Eubacterium sp.]
MKRNSTRYNKYLFNIIITIFIFSAIFFSFNIKTVEAADKKSINASDINKMINNPSLCPSYITIEKTNNGVSITTKENYGSEIEINMDQELTLYSLTVRYSPLSIIGSKQLTLVNCRVSKDLKVSSGSNIVFGNGGYIDITGNIYISGNVTLNDTNRWRTNKSFYLDGGTISGSANDGIIFTDTGSIYIQSGSIDVHTKKDGLYSEKDIEIYGGNIKISCKNGDAVHAHYSIKFMGGHLEAETLSKDSSKACICAGNDINISTTCSVLSPENHKINVYMDPWVCIMDSSGNKASKVIIDGKDVPDNNDNSENNDNNNPNGNGGSSSGGNGGSNGNKYSNEWVNGKWYNANGVCDYAGTLSWKSNASGWWVEDSEGWYPVSQWQKIDGKYYYFTASGYMDYSEYRDGCWLGADGAWDEAYSGGHWCSDSTGWWYEDASGWYPVSRWVWIDGYCYYFEASGYMATNKYVDGCWVGADGAWQ